MTAIDMNSIDTKKLLLLFLVALLALSLVSAVAQETDENAPEVNTPEVNAPGVNIPDEERVVIETKDREGPANKGLELEREVRPRLPNYYGQVVDATQREAIYTIQRQYNELIAFLRLRIELLERERDAKVEAVLTPSQLERVRNPVRRTILQR